MLIRFEASNYRSINDGVELSMVAIDRDRHEARSMPNLGESLLHVAAIYGANASGKSNVIAAVTWLRNAVSDSLRYWDDGIPVEPFAFADGHRRPSSASVELNIAGVRFEYAVEVNRDGVLYEGLFHYPEKKRRRVFERDGNELTLQRGLGNLSGTRELLTPRTLALSIARRFDEPLINQFAAELLAIQTLGQVSRRGFAVSHPRPTRRWFEDSADQKQRLFDAGDGAGTDSSDRAQALAMLRLADLGIQDVLFDDREIFRDTEVGTAEELGRNRAQRSLRLLHATEEEAVPFDFASESEGTRTWFHLIGPVLTALKGGSVLLFDELDASLHPTLSAELLLLFQNPQTNPGGAQLIFTSHDTSLLNHLNRDEVWLTEKTPDGCTRLGALAEFAGERVRRSQNLERAYLHGRFGALPDVDRIGVLRALGLIG